MKFDFEFLLIAIKGGIDAIPVTLLVAFFPVVLGTLFGLPIALIRFFEVRFFSPLFKWIVTIIRGIPVVLILLIFYLVFSATFDNIMMTLHLPFTFRDFNKTIIAIFALTISATAGLSEVYRGSLASIKKGQFDAASSIGLTRFQSLFRIIIPQALPVSIPMICNVTISLLKAAALASMVAVVDVLNGALITATSNYKYLEAYIAAAIVYWILALCLERLFYFVEKRGGQAIREVRV